MFQFREAWSFVWEGLNPPKPFRGDRTAERWPPGSRMIHWPLS